MPGSLPATQPPAVRVSTQRHSERKRPETACDTCSSNVADTRSRRREHQFHAFPPHTIDGTPVTITCQAAREETLRREAVFSGSTERHGVSHMTHSAVTSALERIGVPTPWPAVALGDEWQIGEGGRRRLRSPIDGSDLGEIALASRRQTDNALALATQAFREWRHGTAARAGRTRPPHRPAIATAPSRFGDVGQLGSGEDNAGSTGRSSGNDRCVRFCRGAQPPAVWTHDGERAAWTSSRGAVASPWPGGRDHGV